MVATRKLLNEQIMCLSPLIHYHEQTATSIISLVQDLHKLDMYLTKDEEIDTLIKCFNAWKGGQLYNQPIEFKVERNNDLSLIKGDKWYQDGMDRWRSWDATE